MREFFHNMKLSFLLAAVLYIILGLILLIWPGVSATVFCYAFGGILLIYGVVTIVSFFLRDSRCLLYTSDAADEEDRGDLGGRRCIKKKKNEE